MHIKINNTKDVFDLGVIIGKSNVSTIRTLGLFASLQVPKDMDAEFTIHKSVLADSYKSNPSVFGIKILSHAEGFKDSAGFSVPDEPEYVRVQLFRNRKPAHKRRTHVKATVKQVIKEWLDLNLPKEEKLDIPLADVPPFFSTHPEQLAFQVKRETGTPIRIKRYIKKWQISRK